MHLQQHITIYGYTFIRKHTIPHPRTWQQHNLPTHTPPPHPQNTTPKSETHWNVRLRLRGQRPTSSRPCSHDHQQTQTAAVQAQGTLQSCQNPARPPLWHSATPGKAYIVRMGPSDFPKITRQNKTAAENNGKLLYKCNIRTKVNCFENNFFVRTHKAWNALPLSLREMSDSKKFREMLKQHLWNLLGLKPD